MSRKRKKLEGVDTMVVVVVVVVSSDSRNIWENARQFYLAPPPSLVLFPSRSRHYWSPMTSRHARVTWHEPKMADRVPADTFFPILLPFICFFFSVSLFLLPEKYKFSLFLFLFLSFSLSLSLSLFLSLLREVLSSLARSSWIWHVLKCRILHNSISPFISCPPPFVPFRFYSYSDSFLIRIFSYSLISLSCYYLFCFLFLRVSFFFFSWFAYLLPSSSTSDCLLFYLTVFP